MANEKLTLNTDTLLAIQAAYDALTTEVNIKGWPDTIDKAHHYLGLLLAVNMGGAPS